MSTEQTGPGSDLISSTAPPAGHEPSEAVMELGLSVEKMFAVLLVPPIGAVGLGGDLLEKL